MYICTACYAEYEDPPHEVCWCGCSTFQRLIGDDDLFDADELGIDPEVDAERFDNA